MDPQYQKLIETLRGMDGVLVAFSGGVDSSLLLYAAKEALGERAMALIGRSPTYPKSEIDGAQALVEKLGVRYRIVDTDEINNPEFNTNPPSRCFACKTTLFSIAKAVAKEEGLAEVVEGSNADDLGDYRPGLAAAKKLNIRAPLLELKFTKAKIREVSRALNLPTWNKPAMACLSSRIPYGEMINVEKLARIEKAEKALFDLGIVQLRVRDHGTVARIEVEPSEIPRLVESQLREKILAGVKSAGYRYVALDLQGYRTGAMNEVLQTKK